MSDDNPIKEALNDDKAKVIISGEITVKKGGWEKSFEFENIFELFDVLSFEEIQKADMISDVLSSRDEKAEFNKAGDRDKVLPDVDRDKRIRSEEGFEPSDENPFKKLSSDGEDEEVSGSSPLREVARWKRMEQVMRAKHKHEMEKKDGKWSNVAEIELNDGVVPGDFTLDE